MLIYISAISSTFIVVSVQPLLDVVPSGVRLAGAGCIFKRLTSYISQRLQRWLHGGRWKLHRWCLVFLIIADRVIRHFFLAWVATSFPFALIIIILIFVITVIGSSTRPLFTTGRGGAWCGRCLGWRPITL